MSTVNAVNNSTAPNITSTTDKKKTDEKLVDSRGKDLLFSDIKDSMRTKQLKDDEAAKAKSRKSGYDKDMFVKLFVAQMKNQDPMEPMKNEQYMTQMSQFTSVEQITNMATSFEKFTKAFEEKGNLSNTKIDEFLKEFKDTNKALLSKIESLENEIKKLKA